VKTERKQPDPDQTIRCPRLGHSIAFSYCCEENNGRPCFKTLDCWFEHFDVSTYFQQKLGPDEMDRLFSQPPKPKLCSLLELIAKAKQNANPEQQNPQKEAK
jgi:hypothetical protein